jgi:putative ABC transport system permease protein
MPTYVSLWSVVTAIAFSAIVGIFFGIYPAMRASRLDPVDSLRYE